jgi:hypothetical protein
MYILIELGPERCILNIVDGTVKSVFAVYRHSSPSGSQMGMIVNSEKQIKYAVLIGRDAKKAAHNLSSFLLLTLV